MSNQEAIALLRNLEDSLDSYCGLSEEGKTAFRMAIEALSNSEIPNSSDTISRKAAIEAIEELCNECDHDTTWCGDCRISHPDKDAKDVLEALPPAQPERIIHCKDCEWWTKQECSPQGRCALSGMYPTGGWFCGNARMREVTK